MLNYVDCEQSLFCSKIRRENGRDGMRDIRAAGGEAASREPRVAWASENERKERLHWFHTTIWMLL